MNKQACVIALGEIGGKRFMFKNRDRNYIPELKVYHVVRKGVEMVYFKDELTGWCEGINEFGIAVANAALMVVWDEKEGGQKKDNSVLGVIGSKDAERILSCLECRTFDEALLCATTYNSGIKGHTFLSDGVRASSIEHTAKHRAYVEDLSWDDFHVRSNHGLKYPSAGYTIGENKESSHRRMETTKNILTRLKRNSPEDFIKEVYRQRFENLSDPYNVVRKTDNMFTSSQVLYDFEKKKITLFLIPDDSDYLGCEVKVYRPKPSCSFEVKRLGYFDDTGRLSISTVRGNPVRVASSYRGRKNLPPFS